MTVSCAEEAADETFTPPTTDTEMDTDSDEESEWEDEEEEEIASATPIDLDQIFFGTVGSLNALLGNLNKVINYL